MTKHGIFLSQVNQMSHVNPSCWSEKTRATRSYQTNIKKREHFITRGLGSYNEVMLQVGKAMWRKDAPEE